MPEAVATRPQPSPAALALADVIGDPGKLAYRRKVLDAITGYGLRIGTARGEYQVSIDRILIERGSVTIHWSSENWSDAPPGPGRQSPAPYYFSPVTYSGSLKLAVPLEDRGPRPLGLDQWEAWEAICESLNHEAFGSRSADVELGGNPTEIIEWGEGL